LAQFSLLQTEFTADAAAAVMTGATVPRQGNYAKRKNHKNYDSKY